MTFRPEYDRIFSEAKEILQSRKDVGAVKEYVLAIQDQDYRDATLSKIGVFLLEHGRGEEALQFIRSIERPMERADAFVALARAHVHRHEIAKAKESLLEAIATAGIIERSTWEAAAILLQASTDLHQLDLKPLALSTLRRAITLAQK